jgi:biopolymer transport protein ExbD
MQRRRKSEEDIDVNMVPIMNMFLVLIPFLLMSASFLHIKAINTSVPVSAESNNRDSKVKVEKVTVIAEIRENGIHLSAISDSTKSKEIDKWKRQIKKDTRNGYSFNWMAIYLQEIKESYPASDTIIIIPDEDVLYDTIIQAMDAARYSHGNLSSLFPNVVLSGKIG